MLASLLNFHALHVLHLPTKSILAISVILLHLPFCLCIIIFLLLDENHCHKFSLHYRVVDNLKPLKKLPITKKSKK